MKIYLNKQEYKHRFIFLTVLITVVFPGYISAGTNLPEASLLTNKLPDSSSTDMPLPKISSALSIDLSCGNNAKAQQLAKLIKSSKSQQRHSLACNEKLNKIALIKANLLLQEQHVWHNVGNMTPNQLLRHHGFKLPKTYPFFGNQVEAIAGGKDEPEVLFKDFINSPPHRQLLLGEKNFFQSQDQIGVAYLKDLSTEHQHYWVVIIAANYTDQVIKQEHVVKVVSPPPIQSDNRKRLREMKRRMKRNKVKDKYKW